MMKHTTLFRWVLGAAFLMVMMFDTSYTQSVTPAATGTPENRLSLSGTWQFTLASNVTEAERYSQFHLPSFDANGFRSLPVPSNWAMHGFEEPKYSTNSEAEGFYIHTFSVPKALAGKRVVLHFDGVWVSAEVWLNGQPMGRHDSGFTGFAYDVTRWLKTDGDNKLAVRVRQSTKESALDTNDDWTLGGIYRDVWLEWMPRDLYIDRIEVETDFDDQYRDAVLNLRSLVVRRSGADNPNATFDIRAVLTDSGGREAGRVNFNGAVTGGHRENGRDVLLQMPMRSPAHWTAETPNLYNLRVELVVNGTTTQALTERVGFREVSTAGGVFRINGQAVKLRGMCRHEEHPDVGRATTREHWLEDIRLMKAANINTVRTAHYPPAKGFIELCDELGLYVIDEVAMGFGGERLNDPSYASTIMLRTHETLLRDRNRPSVIVWSIGNEDPLTSLHLAALRAVKGMDSTRPTLLPWRAEEELPVEVDILAPHYKRAEEYDRMAAKAKRPVITTEYTHALGQSDFGGLEDRWRALTKHPAGAGGMIWLWADQALRRPVRNRTVMDPLADLGRYRSDGAELVKHSDAGPNEIYDAQGVFGEDGIVNPNRTPQRDYWETKTVYAPVGPTVDRVLITLNQQSVSFPVRNDYDFTNLDTVRIAWRLMADEREIDKGEAKLSATPHTEATLEIPLRAIKKVEANTAYYIHLTFQRADGSSIVERSVRLFDSANTGTGPVNERGPGRTPRVSKKGNRTIVSVGPASYEFDSVSGGLVSASLNKRPMITGSRVSIWRPLTLSEYNAYRQRNQQNPVAADLDRYTATVRRFEVSNEAGATRINVETDNRVDERNSFTARYIYKVNANGALDVEYEIKPSVVIGYLPEIGFEFDVKPELETLRWLGLGVFDSYPNKNAAAIFGAWSQNIKEVNGAKGGIEWARLVDSSGKGLYITNNPYIRLNKGNEASNRLRLLSAMVALSAKFNPPERDEHRLQTTPNRVFAGRFTLRLQ